MSMGIHSFINTASRQRIIAEVSNHASSTMMLTRAYCHFCRKNRLVIEENNNQKDATTVRSGFRPLYLIYGLKSRLGMHWKLGGAGFDL